MDKMRKVNIELFTGDISDHKRLNLENFKLEDFIGIYENRKILELLIERAESELIQATKEGLDTGYNVTYKSPNAKIVDEDKVIHHMSELGVDASQLFASKMIGIGALKKLAPLKPKEFDVKFSDCIMKVGDVKEILVKKVEEK